MLPAWPGGTYFIRTHLQNGNTGGGGVNSTPPTPYGGGNAYHRRNARRRLGNRAKGPAARAEQLATLRRATGEPDGRCRRTETISREGHTTEPGSITPARRPGHASPHDAQGAGVSRVGARRGTSARSCGTSRVPRSTDSSHGEGSAPRWGRTLRYSRGYASVTCWGSAVPLITVCSVLVSIWMRRGLAFSAIGIVTVRTPFS